MAAKVFLLALIVLIVVLGVTAATYLWLAKREERLMQQDKLEHEERIHLDEVAFNGNEIDHETGTDHEHELEFDEENR